MKILPQSKIAKLLLHNKIFSVNWISNSNLLLQNLHVCFGFKGDLL